MRVFKIKQQTESITFELELSKHFKAYLIVHVMLLESVSDSARIVRIINVKEYKNQNYIVKKILVKNQIDEENHYLMK